MEEQDIYNEINSNEEEDSEIVNEDIENESNEIEEKDEEDSEQDISNVISNKELLEYKPDEFQIDKVIIFLQQNNLLAKSFICDKCNSIMKLNKSKNKKDGYVWRCSKRGLNKHDIKNNIRYQSIFEDMKTDIRLLYFIIFYNFVDNKSTNQIFLNCKELSNQLNIETIIKKNISKFRNILHTKIMKHMHNEWVNNLMAKEPCINGKSQIEIDESKVINIDNQTRWMFGICDRGNYDIRIFYVNNNRTRDTLLPLILNNVYTYPNTIINNRDKFFLLLMFFLIISLVIKNQISIVMDLYSIK